MVRSEGTFNFNTTSSSGIISRGYISISITLYSATGYKGSFYFVYCGTTTGLNATRDRKIISRCWDSTAISLNATRNRNVISCCWDSTAVSLNSAANSCRNRFFSATTGLNATRNRNVISCRWDSTTISLNSTANCFGESL